MMFRNNNPDKGTETKEADYEINKYSIWSLEIITPIRGRKLIFLSPTLGLIECLEIITPIRGRKLYKVCFIFIIINV